MVGQRFIEAAGLIHPAKIAASGTKRRCRISMPSISQIGILMVMDVLHPVGNIDNNGAGKRH